MVVDVILWAGDASPEKVEGRNAAVIDVFRATSVMVEALRNGAGMIIPAETIEEAVSTARSFDKDKVLLAGERDTVIIDGFDLDNSPLNFTAEKVRDMIIVQTTTNGTRAVRNAADAEALYIASFLNLSAVCGRLAADGRDIVLVCSGTKDRFTAEDGLCAGAMAGMLAREYGYCMTDIAGVMAGMYSAAENDIRARLAGTKHYNYILGLGYEADIEFCLKKDIYEIVPRYHAAGHIDLTDEP